MATVGKRLLGKVDKYANIVGAIGEKHRLGILFLLSRGDMDLTDLSHALNLDKPGTIHHLRILKRMGWIIRVKSGKRAYFRLIPNALKVLKGFIAEMPQLRSFIEDLY